MNQPRTDALAPCSQVFVREWTPPPSLSLSLPPSIGFKPTTSFTVGPSSLPLPPRATPLRLAPRTRRRPTRPGLRRASSDASPTRHRGAERVAGWAWTADCAERHGRLVISRPGQEDDFRDSEVGKQGRVLISKWILLEYCVKGSDTHS